MFVLYIFLISIVLQQVELVEASRSFSRYPPPPPPIEIIHGKVKNPSSDNFSFNDSKNKYEKKDIPPVTPGHSPGMGHDTPPGAL